MAASHTQQVGAACTQRRHRASLGPQNLGLRTRRLPHPQLPDPRPQRGRLQVRHGPVSLPKQPAEDGVANVPATPSHVRISS